MEERILGRSVYISLHVSVCLSLSVSLCLCLSVSVSVSLSLSLMMLPWFSIGCLFHSASSSACLFFNHFTELCPSTGLRDCCSRSHSSASGLRLRLLARTDLRVRRMRTRFGNHAFSAASPRCWNRLPPAIRLANSVDSFKSMLKSHMFARAYPDCC